MRTYRNVVVLLAIMAGASVLRDVSAQTPVQLKPGDPAPPFSLVGSDGRTYTLAGFRGKEAVVLAWFVKAFTGP
jgi:peroxiredoxin Q/BCP